MDAACAHMLGTNRQGHCRALGLRSGVRRRDKKQWLVRSCPPRTDTDVDARDHPRLARQEQTQTWMHEIIQQGLKHRFESHPVIRKRMETLEQEVLKGRNSSFRAARELLETYSDLKPIDH